MSSKSKSTKTKRATHARKPQPESELGDDALDQVAGGGGVAEKVATVAEATSEMQFDLQNTYQQSQLGFQTLSRIQKANHDNAQAIIKNLKG